MSGFFWLYLTRVSQWRPSVDHTQKGEEREREGLGLLPVCFYTQGERAGCCLLVVPETAAAVVVLKNKETGGWWAGRGWLPVTRSLKKESDFIFMFPSATRNYCTVRRRHRIPLFRFMASPQLCRNTLLMLGLSGYTFIRIMMGPPPPPPPSICFFKGKIHWTIYLFIFY